MSREQFALSIQPRKLKEKFFYFWEYILWVLIVLYAPFVLMHLKQIKDIKMEKIQGVINSIFFLIVLMFIIFLVIRSTKLFKIFTTNFQLFPLPIKNKVKIISAFFFQKKDLFFFSLLSLAAGLPLILENKWIYIVVLGFNFFIMYKYMELLSFIVIPVISSLPEKTMNNILSVLIIGGVLFIDFVATRESFELFNYFFFNLFFGHVMFYVYIGKLYKAVFFLFVNLFLVVLLHYGLRKFWIKKWVYQN